MPRAAPRVAPGEPQIAQFKKVMKEEVRTTRKREKTEAMKVADRDATQNMAMNRLAALEKDNYDEGLNAEDLVEYGATAAAAPAPGGRRKSAGAAEERRKPFEDYLVMDGIDRMPPGVPNYYSATCAPGDTPPRHFCPVCGQAAPYRDPETFLRYDSAKCLGVLRETRNLLFKFTSA